MLKLMQYLKQTKRMKMYQKYVDKLTALHQGLKYIEAAKVILRVAIWLREPCHS